MEKHRELHEILKISACIEVIWFRKYMRLMKHFLIAG